MKYFSKKLIDAVKVDLNLSGLTQSLIDTTKSKHKALLKLEFRDLVLKYHPDSGGSNAEFIAMQQEHTELEQMIDSIGSVIKCENNSTLERSTDPNDPNTYKVYPNGYVVLGVERTKRKQRAVEPQHVEIKFNVSVGELLKGFKQELKYTRRIYYPTKILLQEVTLEVYVHSSYINKQGEIVYKGYGDQGLFDDKADLVLLLRIEGDYGIVFSDDPTELPMLVQEIALHNWDTSYTLNDKDLGISKTLDINDKTVAATLKGYGLQFRVADNSESKGYRLVRGAYKVRFMRYA